MIRKLNLIIIFVLIAFQALLSADELKLTHPNGGEVLKSGEVTKITWEGLSAEELVKLNFSTDNGATWNTIADSINGSTYDWVAPLVESDSCLVSVHSILEKYNEGENGVIEWSKTFVGSSTEFASTVKQTIDGGYIIAGGTESKDGEITNQKGIYDYWILKLKEDGELEWQKSFGGSEADMAISIIQANDGGYIISGYSQSTDGDITNPKGKSDYWILKLKEDGELEWQKSFGGSRYDGPNSIVQTIDGGYIIAGYSDSKDGEITNQKGSYDYWILKLKEDGEPEWQKSFGGSRNDVANSIAQTNEGGYIVAGYSESTDGEITTPKGSYDYWILKLKEDGELEWQKSYGGSLIETTSSITQTIDGGFIISGYSQSTDGDITNPKGKSDYWILKLKIDGELEWQKSFGGSKDEIANSLVQTFDGGYIIAGGTESTDGDISNPKGRYDYWILKLKEDGELDWQKSLGGTNDEQANSIAQTFDGGFIIAGQSKSKDGDIPSPVGYKDIWIVKIESNYKPLQSDTSDAVFSIKVLSFDYFVSTNEQNSTVTATVILEENTIINLEIYDILGRRVVDLFSGEAMMGKNEYKVDFAEFQSGRYYIKLTSPTITKTEMFEVVR